jgi:hypothetical protein
LKNHVTIFAVLALLLTASSACKKETPSSPQKETPPQVLTPQSGYIDVSFGDTVSLAVGVQLIEGLSLTVLDTSYYNSASPHRMTVGVPYGEEQKWADSLRTYSIVAFASPVYIVSS